MNLRILLSRRVRVLGVGVAAVLVLVAGVIVALTGGGGPPVVRLSAPSYVADPVPKPKKIGHEPANCGVRKATIRKYVPGGHLEDGECSYGWTSRKRRIRLVVDFGVEPRFADEFTSGKPADGNALRLMNPADPQHVVAGPAVRPVSGLGEEALYEYAPVLDISDREDDLTDGIVESGPGAALRFRVGASVVAIAAIRDQDAKAAPPERQVRPAVFAAAADVARALHVPAKPVFTPGKAGTPPPITHPVRPCDLVPDDLANRLAPKAEGARPRDEELIHGAILPFDRTAVVPSYGEAVDSCVWEAGDDYSTQSEGGKHYRLAVTVLTETNWRPGIAVPQATRQYLVLHDDARAVRGPYFHAVRGLGDQAFTGRTPRSFADDRADGSFEVTFRRRDLVVVVDYSGSGLSGSQAINGAYTVAAGAQEALR